MTSQKRPASEVLTQHRSSKVARTSLYRTDTEPGVRASPSQDQGLLAKWVELGKETWRYWMGSPSDEGLPIFNFDSPPHSKVSRKAKDPTPMPPPRRLPARLKLVTPSNILASTSSSHLASRPPYSSSSATSSSDVGVTATLDSTPRMSTATSRTPSTSLTIPSCTRELDEVQYLLNRSRLSNVGDDSVQKPYKTRKHIYELQHRKMVKEQLREQLFKLRVKTTGYASDYSTFKDYLDYRELLETMHRKSESKVRKSKVYEEEQTVSQDKMIMMRAEHRAKLSLHSPKPAKPFSPSLEELQNMTREKDELIKRRLHPKRPSLPENLPDDALREVEKFKKKKGVVASAGRQNVKDEDLRRLYLPGTSGWLNDEVINFYGELIMQRASDAESEKENGRKLPSVHYFSSFFWSKLVKDGYEKGRLGKWTKKIDIFKKDLIILAVNHNSLHWTSAAINFKRKRIESYDSMAMDRSAVYSALRGYLDAEHKNKKKKPFDFTGWEDFEMEEYPQQENAYDCGVFTCATLEMITRGEEEFNFTQANMKYIRNRMIWEIGRAKLADPS